MNGWSSHESRNLSVCSVGDHPQLAVFFAALSREIFVRELNFELEASDDLLA